MNHPGTGRWFPGRAPDTGKRLRLFCLPYAGAGASIYRGWVGAFGPDVDVCPVELPGRETRHKDPPFRSFDALVPALGDALRPWVETPFALFGHSLGGAIAYEVTRWFEATLGRSPVHLFVSARRAPHVPDAHEPLSHLSDDAFVSAVSARYDGIPHAVRNCAELMELLLPRLRADFELLESWQYVDGARLACPVTAFGGERDSTVRVADLEAWREHTRARFELKIIPGPHLFLANSSDRVIAGIREQLAQGTPAGLCR